MGKSNVISTFSGNLNGLFIYLFIYLFIFATLFISLSLSTGKRSTLAKIPAGSSLQPSLPPPSFYGPLKFFWKTKRGLSHFFHDFWRIIFLFLHSINWPCFIVQLSLLREIVGNMCIVIACSPNHVMTLQNLKLTLFY